MLKERCDVIKWERTYLTSEHETVGGHEVAHHREPRVCTRVDTLPVGWWGFLLAVGQSSGIVKTFHIGGLILVCQHLSCKAFANAHGATVTSPPDVAIMCTYAC